MGRGGAMLLAATGLGGYMVVQIGRAPVATLAGAAARDIARNSLAVLPLENVTGVPEQEHFVAGMHDALITDLGKIAALSVKAASSSRVYRNVVQPVRQTGRELRAAHVVEGSVFRTGHRMRPNVQLVDTATEESVWSESYERDIEDVLTLQSEVARAHYGWYRQLVGDLEGAIEQMQRAQQVAPVTRPSSPPGWDGCTGRTGGSTRRWPRRRRPSS